MVEYLAVGGVSNGIHEDSPGWVQPLALHNTIWWNVPVIPTVEVDRRVRS